MELEFDVQILKKDIYDYQLHHIYTSPSGLFGTIVGFFMIAAAFQTRTVILGIMGVFIIGYFPWILNIKSAAQAASPAFKDPIHYKMDDEGIEISKGEESQKIEWNVITKAISTRKSIVLYTSRVNAFIFPRRVLGEKTSYLIEMISTHVGPEKVKIRGAI